jgi:hypothetical protein
VRQKENDMCDEMKPTGVRGLVQFRLRNGYTGVLAVNRIANCFPRKEGGVRLFVEDQAKPILLDLSVEQVMAALQAAEGGGHA